MVVKSEFTKEEEKKILHELVKNIADLPYGDIPLKPKKFDRKKIEKLIKELNELEAKHDTLPPESI